MTSPYFSTTAADTAVESNHRTLPFAYTVVILLYFCTMYAGCQSVEPYLFLVIRGSSSDGSLYLSVSV